MSRHALEHLAVILAMLGLGIFVYEVFFKTKKPRG